jgi:hypothetical protein
MMIIIISVLSQTVEEVVMAYFGVLWRYVPETTEVNQENQTQSSWCPSWDSNKYKLGIFPCLKTFSINSRSLVCIWMCMSTCEGCNFWKWISIWQLKVLETKTAHNYVYRVWKLPGSKRSAPHCHLKMNMCLRLYHPQGKTNDLAAATAE